MGCCASDANKNPEKTNEFCYKVMHCFYFYQIGEADMKSNVIICLASQLRLNNCQTMSELITLSLTKRASKKKKIIYCSKKTKTM